MWKLINKENGNSQKTGNIIINTGDDIITNPQTVSDRLNIFFFFAEVTEDLLSQNSCHCLRQKSQFQIKNCFTTMFVSSVTVNEVEQAIKSLKSITLLAFMKFRCL
jgi:hypothetical protein